MAERLEVSGLGCCRGGLFGTTTQVGFAWRATRLSCIPAAMTWTKFKNPQTSRSAKLLPGVINKGAVKPMTSGEAGRLQAHYLLANFTEMRMWPKPYSSRASGLVGWILVDVLRPCLNSKSLFKLFRVRGYTPTTRQVTSAEQDNIL